MRRAEPRGFKALVAPPLITPRPVYPRNDSVATNDDSSAAGNSGGNVSAATGWSCCDQGNKAARSSGKPGAQQQRTKRPFATAAPKAASPEGVSPRKGRNAKGEAGNDALHSFKNPIAAFAFYQSVRQAVIDLYVICCVAVAQTGDQLVTFMRVPLLLCVSTTPVGLFLRGMLVWPGCM